MTLAPGTKLGSYEILELVGAGGMGEVYKARDTRLGRTVAIKVLPDHLARDPERRQRFEREARAVSSLKHPHICVLHDVGSQDGVDFLVMEYLEGETLADRLRRGPLPLDEAIRHGIAIADALGKAHRQGVVHRDLKPGNVVLTREGPKLLDFGLAKLAEGTEDGLALSSVATEARPLTEDGAILGTLQYMAPEQLEGGDVDARTDLFAFGALLYEMVTGRRAFPGKSRASVIAAILERNPDPMAPAALERVVRRCLAKDPDDRWQNAIDLRAALGWVTDGEPRPPSSKGPARESRAFAFLLVGAAVAALATWSLMRSRAPETRLPLRLTLTLNESERLPSARRPPFDVSPDGRLLVHIARPTGKLGELYLRRLDQLESRRIPGAQGATDPIFSPDGRFIAFVSGGSLFKVAVEGGEPLRICDWDSTRWIGEWGLDDKIYWGGINSGISRVSAAGGEPETVTTVDEAASEGAHRWPHLLPDADALTFTIRFAGGDRTAVHSLRTGERRILESLGHASYARYVPTGHLVYAGSSQLMAVPFDPGRLEPTGSPVPVITGVQIAFGGSAHFSVSRNGILVYNPDAGVGSSVLSVGRNGNATHLFSDPGLFHFPQPSPDGASLLVTIHPRSGQHDLWLYDLARKTRRRLTSGGADNNYPVWAPDGSRIAFESVETEASGTPATKKSLTVVGLEGGAGTEVLVSEDDDLLPGSWSPDGRSLAYTLVPSASGVGGDIWVYSLGAEGRGEPFLDSDFDERMPSFSPDGRFLAYRSDESGEPEIYAVSYPGKQRRIAISRGGGTDPRWSRSTNELFYRDLDGRRMYSVPVEGSSFGEPRLLFEGDYALYFGTNYGVSPDGKTFYMVREIVDPTLNVVVNWFDELRERVPVN